MMLMMIISQAVWKNTLIKLIITISIQGIHSSIHLIIMMILQQEEEEGWKMAPSSFVPAVGDGTNTFKGTSTVY